MREQVAKALLYKGIAFGELGRAEEAIAVYEDVIARFGDAADPAIREQVAKASAVR
jgi:TolA-binding protein